MKQTNTRKVNISKKLKRVLLFIVLVLLIFSVCCKAEDINIEPYGVIEIDTVDIETSEKIENLYVSIYKVANYDDDYNITPIEELENTNIDDVEALLLSVQEKEVLKRDKYSVDGRITFDGLESGRYLVYIPEQEINETTYLSQTFFADIPMKLGNVYTYLIQATPKISKDIANTNTNPKAPQTSYNGMPVIFFLGIGTLSILVGSVIYIYESKKNK